MLERFSVPAFNRLLRANAWALERLRPHAGKTALLTCAPAALKVTVREGGELAPAAPEVRPDLTIHATAPLLLRLAAGDEAARSQVTVSGDVQFAATLDHLRRNLAWDYEEDLARVLGDVLAHRAAGAGRELDRWARSTVLNVSRAFTEYWTHERPLIASREALDELHAEIDRLRDDAERLEKRIELVRQSAAPPGIPAGSPEPPTASAESGDRTH
jgi:ubiquinone biosynthesis accessory factor UbiJ